MRRSTLLPVCAALLIACAGVVPAAGHALADNPAPEMTPTPIPTVVPTAIPTPSPAAEVTDTPLPVVPTAVEERSTPTVVLATIAVPTATAIPTSTPVPERRHATTTKPTPTPLPALSTPTPQPVDSGPTPAQLEQSARLRWGDRVPPSVRRWAFLIVPIARTYHLDPNLVAAVMTMESNGDPLAESPSDARGLMQILHGPWDPRENVTEGCKFLAELYGEFGDWTLALAAYNAGPGAVEAYNGVPPIPETQDYVVIVTYLWDLYDHHHLSVRRVHQYTKTLSDLRRFRDQRKKVSRLAKVAHIPYVPAATCALSCHESAPAPVSALPDPFWPDTGAPDPLQRVVPPPTLTRSTVPSYTLGGEQ